MICPRCKTQYVCPCKHCAKTFSKDKVAWISHEDDTESCPTCGLRKHIDEWGSIEMEQWEMEGKKMSKDKFTPSL